MNAERRIGAASWPISETLRAYLEVQYELVRVLGQGGMGAVLLANERALDRRVAIKVLRPDAAGQDELRERFRREARTAARLTHPNIVPLYTFGEVESELYFVMGFVEGETLADRLRREGTLDPADVRRLMSALAEALDYAHRAGIVHRDLKPDNVLIDGESGRPLLTDFGIARETTVGSELTRTGVIVGTPHYMSPEQAAADRNVDGRSDLYSLGVIGYRAFAGRLPFGGGSLQEVLAQHLSAEPAPLTPGTAEGDPALAEVIARALRKSPVERWQSGREIVDALRSNDEGELLPDAIAGLEGSFTRITAGLGALTIFTAILPLYGARLVTAQEQGLFVAAFAALAALVPLVGGVATRSLHKMPWSRVWRLGFRAPRSWKSWWPLALRRPGDVWHRLPREARLLRALNEASAYVLLPLELLFGAWMLTPAGQEALIHLLMTTSKAQQLLLLAPVLAFTGGIVGTMAALMRQLAKRLQLSRTQVGQLMAIPNADPRWRQERYARSLAPVAPGRTIAGAGATGNAEALDAIVRELGAASVALPPALRDDVRAANSARTEIALEMERLRREVDPEEVGRLDRRIAALGGERDAELRGLLEGQRALLARLEARIAMLGAQKLRLDEQLRLLHQQLVELRARDADPHEEITARIRAANSELRRLSEAWSEAERIGGEIQMERH
jgi:predicted Ser/Thr protein kinase